MTEGIQRFRFHNRREVSIELLMEPWGMPLNIAPRSSFEIVVHGPDGTLEVDLEDSDRLVVHVWSGCRVVVLAEGDEIYSTLEGPPVPGTPAGTSVRDLLGVVLGRE